jgi:ABC-type amino acid transport substrate-binding protein
VILLLCIASSVWAELPPDIERILKKGKITVAMYHEDIAPFFMHDREGTFYGFDVEMAKEVAKRMGVEPEFNRAPKTFDAVVEMVRQRKADVAISIISKTLSRALRVRFTDSYINLYKALVINRLEFAKKMRAWENILEALNETGIKIGVVEGTAYVGFAEEEFPNATIVKYKKWEMAIKNAVNGKIVAVFGDDIEVKNWNRSHPETGLYAQTMILKDKKDPLAFAVHWEDEHLLSWLNVFLQTLKNDGTYNRLLKKYITSEE